jgi:probable rRNA maturation factor
VTNNIRFFKEDIRFRLLYQKKLQQWIKRAVKSKKFQIEEINYIFCSDQHLLHLNKQFLGHDFYTDIITFDNSEEKKKISADIFISVERVKANAEKYNTAFKDELHRVLIHGVLHLLGYKDKTKKDREKMRMAEDKWLSKRNF